MCSDLYCCQRTIHLFCYKQPVEGKKQFFSVPPLVLLPVLRGSAQPADWCLGGGGLQHAQPLGAGAALPGLTQGRPSSPAPPLASDGGPFSAAGPGSPLTAPPQPQLPGPRSPRPGPPRPQLQLRPPEDAPPLPPPAQPGWLMNEWGAPNPRRLRESPMATVWGTALAAGAPLGSGSATGECSRPA